MELPRELITAAKNNNLILFVGAGISNELRNNQGEKIGFWKDLVKQISKYSSDKGYYTDLIEFAINQNDTPFDILRKVEILNLLPKSEKVKYVKAYYSDFGFNDKYTDKDSQFISNIIPKSKVIEFVKNYFDLDKNNDWDLHRKLCNLSNIIITTNYDNAFELTCKELNKHYSETITELNASLSKKTDSQCNTALFKLHGSILSPESMVIFPTDYAQLYEHRINQKIIALENLILKKNILFIGYGMNDWQINKIFLFAKNKLADISQPHFIITMKDVYEKNSDKLGDFLTPIFITKYRRDEKSQKNEYNIDNIVERLLKEKMTAISEIKPNYFKLGNELFNTAILLKEEKLWNECCELYAKAALFVEDRTEDLFNKWGYALLQLAQLQKSESLIYDSIEKYKIARQLNPYGENTAYNLQKARETLLRVNVNSIIEDYYSKQLLLRQTMIPVKECTCGYINQNDRISCRHCGKPLGEKWLDNGHISSGICLKCKRYVGMIGETCPQCGNKVPYFYENFFCN